MGSAYVGSGLLAWYRRPANRTGPLLVAAGLVMYVAGFELTGTPGLSAIGLVLSLAPVAVILHLLLAFPTGRLTTRAGRALAIAGYVVISGGDLVRYVLAPGVPAVVAVAGSMQRIGAIAVIVATSGLLVHRFRLATSAQRRTLAPLYAFGVLTICYIVFAANVLPPLLGLDLSTVAATQVMAIGLIPFAFTVGVLRGGFAGTAALEDLGLWLARGDRDPGALRSAVAETLGDPTAQVVFRVDDGYVDAGGNPAAPEPGLVSARAVHQLPELVDGGTRLRSRLLSRNGFDVVSAVGDADPEVVSVMVGRSARDDGRVDRLTPDSCRCSGCSPRGAATSPSRTGSGSRRRRWPATPRRSTTHWACRRTSTTTAGCSPSCAFSTADTPSRPAGFIGDATNPATLGSLVGSMFFTGYTLTQLGEGTFYSNDRTPPG